MNVCYITQNVAYVSKIKFKSFVPAWVDFGAWILLLWPRRCAATKVERKFISELTFCWIDSLILSQLSFYLPDWFGRTTTFWSARHCWIFSKWLLLLKKPFLKYSMILLKWPLLLKQLFPSARWIARNFYPWPFCFLSALPIVVLTDALSNMRAIYGTNSYGSVFASVI